MMNDAKAAQQEKKKHLYVAVFTDMDESKGGNTHGGRKTPWWRVAS